MNVSLVWFRNDLRLADHPALIAALGSGRPVVPVYVFDPEAVDTRPMGAASRWWLHGSLSALDAALRALGSRLVVRRGPAVRTLEDVARACGATALYWNHACDAGARQRDAGVKHAFAARGLRAEALLGNLLFEPWQVKKPDGGPYKVFGAFWRACRALPSPGPALPAPKTLRPPDRWPDSDDIATLGLLPTAPDWAGGLRALWTPGETAAQARLASFLDETLAHYGQQRDRPAADATSRLSPISPSARSARGKSGMR